ncbi:MAG: type II toxin-antitoxin system YafQ family toxin [Elusimicrobiota bacterium]
MYKIYITKTFDRRIKQFLRSHPELENEIKQKLDLLIRNPFDPQLRTHKLSGRLKNEFAFRLTYEYRIFFVLVGFNIYLTNIGSHDEIY